ncbi:unnamed protein product [Haemonchus placei]|uniref:Uncharacterized protein n=1 Tax=Haemonchus placei TaxID=6290 RepID=A0A0N4WEQ6_HAEPC|nr:unnamed protein product [Haemonchus placei]
MQATGPVTGRPTNTPVTSKMLMSLKEFRCNATASAGADAHSQGPVSVKSMRGSPVQGRHRGATKLVRKPRNVWKTRVATLNVGTLTGRSATLSDSEERGEEGCCF